MTTKLIIVEVRGTQKIKKRMLIKNLKQDGAIAKNQILSSQEKEIKTQEVQSQEVDDGLLGNGFFSRFYLITNKAL